MLHIVTVIMTCYQCIVAIAVYAIHVATAVYTSRKFNHHRPGFNVKRGNLQYSGKLSRVKTFTDW